MRQSERDQCWLFILLEDMASNDYFIRLPFLASFFYSWMLYFCVSIKLELNGFSMLVRAPHAVEFSIDVKRLVPCHKCSADERARPHAASFPAKCFNSHLVILISLGEMMAVWWAGLLLLVSYKISQSPQTYLNAILPSAVVRPLFYLYVLYYNS